MEREINKEALSNQVVLITGAGGGIGRETAKLFTMMGATVIIAEIDREKGKKAEQMINQIYPGSTEFYAVDLSSEEEIYQMKEYIIEKYGCPDIVFNNATTISIGEIEHISSETWDFSYRVNLKAPILLTQCFLTAMKERNSGVFVFVSSSGASPYMGAYEIFKTSQVELSNTLSMELEDTNVYAYTIGPGLVKTETASHSIELVAKKMGMTTDAFYQMNASHMISVEEAALGFALSVTRAKEYNGLEIGSIQVLNSTEFIVQQQTKSYDKAFFDQIFKTYQEQYQGWKKMNIFEKQWVLRDFKKVMSLSVDEVYQQLQKIKERDTLSLSLQEIALLKQLKQYWQHQYDLLQGFERNQEKLKTNSAIIKGWILDIEQCIKEEE